MKYAEEILNFPTSFLRKVCISLFLILFFSVNSFGQTEPDFKWLDDYSLGSGGLGNEGGIVISVDTDSEGNVYVLTFGNGVYKYDPYAEKYDLIIADQLAESEDLNGPLDLAIDNNDIIHIADSGSKSIKRFTTEGDELEKIGGLFGTGENEFLEPTGLEFDDDNNLYIVDSYRGDNNNVDEKYFLKIYYANGDFRSFKGTNEYPLNNPYRVAATDDYILISNAENNGEVLVFDKDLNFIRTLNNIGSPGSLFVDKSGFIYAVDYADRVDFNDVFKLLKGDFFIALSLRSEISNGIASGDFNIQVYNPDLSYNSTISDFPANSNEDHIQFPLDVTLDETCGKLFLNDSRIEGFATLASKLEIYQRTPSYDQEKPEIDCPEDIVVIAETGDDFAIVSYDDATALDNCDSDVGIAKTEGQDSGSEFSIGKHEIEFTATDDSGNTTTCTFTITVNPSEDEVTPPEFDNCSTTTITKNNDPEECGAIVRFETPTASDENGNVEVTRIDTNTDLVSGSLFPVGTTTITFQADDGTNDPVTCSFDIIVQDTEAPVLTCEQTRIVEAEPGETSAVVNFILPPARDGCDGILPTRISDGSMASGSRFPIGTTNIVFEATDQANNTGYCTLQIRVLAPKSPPEFNNCSTTTITKNNDPGECGAIVRFDTPTASDEDGNVEVTRIDANTDLVSGSLFPVGTTTITFQADDGTNDPVTCSFDIIVQDTEAPELTCVPDITAQASPGNDSKSINFSPPTACDNCDGVLQSRVSEGSLVSGSNFPIGSTDVVFEATDSNGNMGYCTLNVNILPPNYAPSIACPADISVPNDSGICGALVEFADPTVTDPEDDDLTITRTDDSGLNSGDIFPVGTTTIVYQVSDGINPPVSCDFTITVENTEQPQFSSCPENMTELLSVSESGKIIFFDLPKFEDNCSEAELFQTAGPESGEFFPAGETEVRFELRANNTVVDQCSFTVDLVRQTESFQCIESITINLGEEAQNSSVTEIPTSEFILSDSSNLDFELNVQQFTCEDIGTFDLPIRATDVTTGEELSCTVEVTVLDRGAPLIICPAGIQERVIPANGNFVLPQIADRLSIVDNCADFEDLEIIQDPPEGTLYANPGDYEVSITATDPAGNEEVCEVIYRLTREEEPEEFALNCPQNENVIKADENCEYFVPDFSKLINYSPANATFSQSIPVGTKIEEQTVITVTASFNGESDSCTFDLVLKDNTPPVVNCPADKTIVISEGESIPIADYRNELEVSDNCGLGEITQVPEPGTLISEDTEVSFLVFDSASTANAAVCSFMLTLAVDTEGNDIPVANEDFYSTPVNSTLNISVEEGVLANDMDADGDELTATLVEDVTNGTLEFNSDGSFVYTPNDDFVGEDTFRYYVFDGFTEVETIATINVLPVDTGEFQCVENYLLELDENGTAQLPVSELYTGDASGVSFSLDQEFFDCNDLGTNQIILSYSGESDGACEIRVEVVDRIQPEFEVQNIDIDLDLSGNAIITAEEVVVNFRDNCDETINFELSQDSFSCKDLGWNEINVIATDASGNSTTTSVEVQVFAEIRICNGTGEGSEYIFIYPNPNRGNFKVATPADVSISRIEVFDHRGRFITGKDFPENASEYAISTGPLQEAVYVVKMITNEGEKTKRFIIKN
ncbi:HYR domain-containing protein [Christiangramia portivictoriae]|uniref:HYR domain-containing protein n=1 Tax=Christiangramia portivictoriae TaxID=326069 RepID=UPI0004797B00|nr:HYR domain-containing protein [Christiangramia portivictoriae]